MTELNPTGGPWAVPLPGTNNATITTADIAKSNDPGQIVNVGGLEMTAKQAQQAGLVIDKGEAEGFVSADPDNIQVSPDIDNTPGVEETGIDPTAPHVGEDIQDSYSSAVLTLSAVEKSTGADAGGLVDGLLAQMTHQVTGEPIPDGALGGLEDFKAKMNNIEQLQTAADGIVAYSEAMFEAIAAHDHITFSDEMLPALLSDPAFSAAVKGLLQGGQSAIGPVRALIQKHNR